MSRPKKGFHFSDEQKKKLRLSHLGSRGYHHSEATKEKLRLSNLGKHNFKHTVEELKKIGEASKKLWQQDWYRDLMIKAQKRPNSGQYKEGHIPWTNGRKLNPEFKKSSRFSTFVRRKVKKEKCLWCGTTERLELDHILAKCNGGKNIIENCQVLCKKCNLIKRDTIDQVMVQIKNKQANSVKS